MSHRSGDPRGDDRRRTPRVSCRLHGRVVRGRERLRVRIVDVSEGGLCLLSPVWLNPKQTVVLEIDVPGRATAKVQIEVWHVRREKSRSTAGKVWVAGAILRDADTAYGELLQAAGLAASPTRGTPLPSAGVSGARPRAPSASIPGSEPSKTSSDRSATSPAPGAPPTSRSTTRPTANPTARSARPSGPHRSSPSLAAASAKPGGPNPAKPEAPNDALDSVEPRVFRLHCKARGSPRTRVLTLAAESPEQARKLAEADLGATWDLLEVREV